MTRRKPAAVTRLAPRGIWLGASVVRGRPCPVGEPYPHIHGEVLPVTGRLMPRSGCAACPAQPQRRERPGLTVPGVSDEG